VCLSVCVPHSGLAFDFQNKTKKKGKKENDIVQEIEIDREKETEIRQ